MDADLPIEQVLATKPLSDEAKIRLLRQFEPFCRGMVKRIIKIPLSKSYGDGDDWFQEAQIALISTGERFDASRGLKFITYATARVYGLMRSKMRFHNGLIRVPAAKVLKPIGWELIKVLTPDRIRFFDYNGAEDGGNIPTYDHAHYYDEPSSMVNVVAEIAKLKSQQRYVIERRFGLSGERVWKIRELADELGLTKQRIHQIQVEALKSLREKIGKN